jgi:hypothetical protein
VLPMTNHDVETVMQPENVVELEYALESATTFGMSSIMENIRVLFTDYSEDSFSLSVLSWLHRRTLQSLYGFAFLDRL